MELQTNQTPEVSTPKPQSKFRPGDGLYAVLSLIFAFFFLKYTFASTPGIALTVLTVCFVGATVGYALLRGRKITFPSVFWGILTIGISLTYCVAANGFLKGWCVVFQLLAGAYWIYLTFGNRFSPRPDDMLGFDLLKCLFVLPFGNMGTLFAALGESGKQNKSSKRILFIFLGLIFALIPTAIVFSLLTTGDSVFANMMDYLFSDVGEMIGNNLGCFFFTLPVSLLLFGLWNGAARQTYTTALSPRVKDQVTHALRFASPLITCAALIPMLVIYVLYFVSQAGYFLGAFENLKPEGYSYAEYAREGFFHLCAVCAINGMVILAVHFLTKRKETKEYALPAKIIVSLFALSSIVLAVIALRKMAMYINQYGLTLPRVYASWFMILLSVFFLILIVKQFWKRLNAVFCALIAFLVLFSGLCLVNVDARIAEYNLNRYLVQSETNSESELDLEMFENDLSYAAVVAVDKVYDALDADAQRQADEYFEQCARGLSGDLEWDYDHTYSFRSWNWDTFRAERILRNRCPQKFTNTSAIFGWAW